MNKQNSKPPMNKKAMTIMWVVIAAIMVFAAVGDDEALFPAIGTMVMVSVIMLVSAAVNKKTAHKNDAPAKRVDRPTPTVLRHDADHEAEQAVGCHHATGKEKYIQQLDGYLKAGLIDKAEYKVLKERYSKLEIPEDYH